MKTKRSACLLSCSLHCAVALEPVVKRLGSPNIRTEKTDEADFRMLRVSPLRDFRLLDEDLLSLSISSLESLSYGSMSREDIQIMGSKSSKPGKSGKSARQCQPSSVKRNPFRPYKEAVFELKVRGYTDNDVTLKTSVVGNYNIALEPDGTYASFYWVNKTGELVFIGNNFGRDYGEVKVKSCTDSYYESEFVINAETYNLWAKEGKVEIHVTFSPEYVNDVCDGGNKVFVQLGNESSELFAPTSKRVDFVFPKRERAKPGDEIVVSTFLLGSYESDQKYATFYLTYGDDAQTADTSRFYLLGENSGGNLDCPDEYYQQDFSVPYETFNEFIDNRGRVLHVLMVQSYKVFDGPECSPRGSGVFNQTAYVQVTDPSCA